ncbi:hypothetical protein IHE45_07G081700 [Dioscorea alata]|uniref:Uncharacterized protein n=1 Tax=Dioscorea alata TaxID=55571 RepID=A0ACB7VRW7_DIOAL|nr:hypothetical protein IHE45_07G081700 [Dioscorea alata]
MAFLSSVLQITRRLVTAFSGSPSSSSRSSSSSTDAQKVIEDELKGLEMTLWNIEALLEDAGRREIRDASVRLWLKELKGIAYDAEDVLDEYEYELLRYQVEYRTAAAAAAVAARTSRKRKSVEVEDEVCVLMFSCCSGLNSQCLTNFSIRCLIANIFLVNFDYLERAIIS